MTNDTQLPLERGDEGHGIRDLQALLDAAGFAVDSGETGTFGASTRSAVLAFQGQRGLEVDGIVGTATWSSLVEASFAFGDRLLCLRTPMMRGDDVTELQMLLGSLGFDTDKVDGIFGEDTQRAVGEFQRSIGLVADEVCGPDTAVALRRLRSRGGNSSVAFVREREELARANHRLDSLSICVVHDGTLNSLSSSIASRLSGIGSTCAVIAQPDRSAIAVDVNNRRPDLCIGLRAAERPGLRVAYFASAGYLSEGGRRLASLIAHETPRLHGVVSGHVAGMRLPLLRETSCVAVEIRFGKEALEGDGELAFVNGLQRAIERWAGATAP